MESAGEIAALHKALAPIQCRIRGAQTNHTKTPDRLATLLVVDHKESTPTNSLQVWLLPNNAKKRTSKQSEHENASQS